MKRLVSLICFMLIFFAGCAGREATSSTSEASQSIGLPSTVSADSEAGDTISQELRGLCEDQMNRLFDGASLYNSWEGSPVALDDPPAATVLTITAIEKADDVITVTAELYGDIYIDPVTLEETIGYGVVCIIPQTESDMLGLAFGESIVRFKESAEGLTPLSCTYEKFPQPGLDYLKAQTEKLQPDIDTSEKIDISKYDQRLVEYIWQVLSANRYIEKPADITLYDLENIRGAIELPHSSIYDADTEDTQSPDYRLDASLLRLIPHLEAITCPYRLTDYSVFENMHDLKKLTLHNAGNDMVQTIKVGHTDELMLYAPDIDMLDLTNVNTEALRLYSWNTAIGGFTGCEKIKKLYIMSTRTDMRLVGSVTFPNASYLNLYFYSDASSVRDLSQLTTLQDAKIDLYLDYQACNNQTLESLREVQLNEFVFNPENGTNPIQNLDFAIIDSLNTKKTTIGMDMYFQERTGDEDIGS